MNGKEVETFEDFINRIYKENYTTDFFIFPFFEILVELYEKDKFIWMNNDNREKYQNRISHLNLSFNENTTIEEKYKELYHDELHFHGKMYNSSHAIASKFQTNNLEKVEWFKQYIDFVQINKKSYEIDDNPGSRRPFYKIQEDKIEEVRNTIVKFKIKYETEIKTMIENHKNEFKSTNSLFDDFAIDLKQNLLKSSFTISKYKEGNTWLWIADNYTIIGHRKAHYEFILYSKAIYLELHFEDQKSRIQIQNQINEKLINYDDEVEKIERKFGLRYITDEITAENAIEKLEEFDKLIGDDVRRILGELESTQNNESDKPKTGGKNTIMKTTHPLNQILYGPPGTGKTYHAINKAVEIIDPSSSEKHEELKTNGQIEFVTFHQSYGYEEFIEGIKAKTHEGNISYKIEDGIFKRISKRAMFSYFYARYIAQIKEKLEKGEEVSCKGKRTEIKIVRIEDKSQIITLGENQPKETPVSEERLWKIYDSHISINDLTNDKINEIIGVITEPGRFHAVYNDFMSFLDKDTSLTASSENKFKNYVLIIDEINRGNISKIFGELITLIEPSKRKGNTDSLEVTLPYSQDKFSVPPNLYIIGTMNTADRSIALMDIALRRRFQFVEMMPNSSILAGIEVKGIKIKDMFETINQRIEYLMDRDHQIGHSSFMPLLDFELSEDEKFEKLCDIFSTEVIPLLQEYFYEDWEKIQIILGDHPKQGLGDGNDEHRLIIGEKKEEKKVIGFDHDDIENDKVIYHVNDKLVKAEISIEAFKKIKLQQDKQSNSEEKTKNEG